MSPRKAALLGCGAALLVAAIAGFAGYRWFHSGGPVDDRLQMIGPQTRAFVTFLADTDEPSTLELFSATQRRWAIAAKEDQPEWVRSVAEFISGSRVLDNPKLLFPLRATAVVESPTPGKSDLVFVLSLGKMLNVLKMFLGVVDSEREKESYRGEKIIIGRHPGDWALALVGNHLIVSREPKAVRILIDRLKDDRTAHPPSPALSAVLADMDPGVEMKGLGGMINDRASLASLWQLVTGAPEGAEVALPPDFKGVGFRFRIVSADAVAGDGAFSFEDEQAATGALPELDAGLRSLFAHYGFEPTVEVSQAGSVLRIHVEAVGLQKALERMFSRVESDPPVL